MIVDLSMNCLGFNCDVSGPQKFKSAPPELDHQVDFESTVSHGVFDEAALGLRRICLGFVQDSLFESDSWLAQKRISGTQSISTTLDFPRHCPGFV